MRSHKWVKNQVVRLDQKLDEKFQGVFRLLCSEGFGLLGVALYME